MPAPATMNEAVVANPALAQLDYATLAALGAVPETERAASEHWIFDKNSVANLQGRIAGGALLPKATTGVASINISNGGSGYTSAPTVALTGGGGAGALAVALITGGVVTAVLITNPGAGYTSPPAVGLTGGAGSGAAAAAILDTSPTHAAGYLTTKDGGLNGLLSPYDDMETQTICVVTRRKALINSGRLLFGSSSNSGSLGGVVAYFTGTTNNVQMRTRQGTNTAVPNTFEADIPIGSWMFAAMVNKPGEQMYFVGGVNPSYDTTTAKTVASRKVGLGNAHYDLVGYQQGADFAEMIAFPGKALTLSELRAVYARSKVRMGRRANAIF